MHCTKCRTVDGMSVAGIEVYICVSSVSSETMTGNDIEQFCSVQNKEQTNHVTNAEVRNRTGRVPTTDIIR